jgi:hypothetical protein
MMGRWPRRVFTALFTLGAQVTEAQVVRGVVRERISSEGFGGTVVELLRQSSSGTEARVASALTDDRGNYAVQAPGAGRFVLVVKRIGVRRYRSEPFALGEGETVVRNVVVDAVLLTLPQVTVTGTTTCSGEAREGNLVAALWDEARTALLATQISLRDRLFRAHVTRYVRELDPKSRRVLSETRSPATGVVSRPFAAVPPETLSARGYWIPRRDGNVTYHGPDAEVLLSEAFLADHCFSAVRTPRNRRGLVGLGFAPGVRRETADIAGTLWLDERSFELRFLEFTYSRAAPGVDSASVGGELHFARLPSGAWIVRRWFLRLPVYARPFSPLVTEETTSPWVLVRPVALRLREEGADVTAEALRPRTPRPGTPNDSLRRPR